MHIPGTHKGFAKMAGTLQVESFMLSIIFVRADDFVHLIRHFANPRTVVRHAWGHCVTKLTNKIVILHSEIKRGSRKPNRVGKQKVRSQHYNH